MTDVNTTVDTEAPGEPKRVIGDDGFSLESRITRAAKHVKKGQPIILVIAGEYNMHFDLPTFSYDNDEQLYTWLSACLDRKVVILNPSDEKIARINDIALMLHIPVFTVVDIPSQEISGTAKSFLSHHDRLSYTELSFIVPQTAEVIKKDITESFIVPGQVPDAPKDTKEGDRKFTSIKDRLNEQNS